MKYTYTAVFSEKNKKVYARVPDLDGCITTGKTLIDAMDQMADAMAAWLCTAEDENLPIPNPTPQSKIAHKSGDMLSIIKADTLAYRASTDTRAVRKNVSLPRWLSILADRKHINCSQVLQEALISRL
ncbi:MAG: type II toxin-antitoxin system HicB family antitoxin [Spirochaetia bacterium]|nr:type II toxin-antitoxin system HicB family antitoxin [Spirochaetia bacterium]